MSELRAERLTKRFGGLAAVSGLNLDVTSGEVLGLIGPNGAGKTTVFNLLTGFIPQDSGTVTLDGASVDGMSPERRCAAGLVRTFQIVQPFRDITVLDNVVMGTLVHTASVREGRRQAEEVLEAVGLGAVAGQLGRSLSIGDRKRLELARAAGAGGILNHTGINFETDGLTGFPTLDSSANNTWGGAVGLNLLPQDFSQQLVAEFAFVQAFGEDSVRIAPGDQYGLGLRYQIPISNAVILRADAMHGFLESADDVSGIRFEFRHKF